RTNSVTTAENDICLAERRLREASMANAAQQMPERVGTLAASVRGGWCETNRLAAHRRSMPERRAARRPLLAGGPPGERNRQYGHGEGTQAGIAERPEIQRIAENASRWPDLNT